MKHAGSINRDGFTLRYRVEGAGPDTLVIGSSVYYSRSFSQDLRQHLRLHFVDYRGFAKGPKGSLEFVTLLEDIEEVRKALGLSKFIIIGHSAHGMLALEYAKKYPEYISHVVIIGMPPHMKEDNQALAKRHWDEAICPERKAALEHNFQLMPDSKLNALPRDEWFLQMNLRNSPKAWYNPLFDSRPLWEGVEPNTDILDQMYLRFTQEVDITARLENFHIPTFLAYGAFEYIVAPVESWSPIRHKFRNLTVRVFDKSAHSPQHEEAPLFNAELLRWLENQEIRPSL